MTKIDLRAIQHNLRVLKRCTTNAEIWPVIKADAYGHGAVMVARALEKEGISGFCVALVEEAIELRHAGIMTPVLILGGAYGNAHQRVLENKFIPVIDHVEELQAFCKVAKTPFEFHLEVDTGMSRLGLPFNELDAFLETLKEQPLAQMTGMMSHLASSSNNPEFTAQQRRRFKEFYAAVRLYVPNVKTHLSNSGAVILRPECHFDLVRPGTSLYGILTSEICGETLRERLLPALTMHTEILHIQNLTEGARVGYGGTFVAKHPMRVATLPIGYADGVHRSSSGKGYVLIGGHYCAVLGRVSMDLMTVDISAVEQASVGDPVVLIGSQGQRCIRVEDAASWGSTMVLEILTTITRRVPRKYLGVQAP